MARIVALSSLVARGHVGLRAIVPALESFGHDVVALPTILLSNHAAYPHLAGTPITPDTLEAMIQAVDDNGWLDAVDAVVTGYMPSTAHVAFAEGLLQRIRAQNPTAFYVCDPVMGDAPKGLYVPHETAAQIRKQLLPLADVVTPNAFELSWLTGLPVTGIAEAAAAAQALLRPTVIATSVTAPGDRLATLLHDSAGTVFTSVFRQPKAPSGTGDLLTGLLTGAVAAGVELRKALALAGAYLNAVVTASGTSDDLNLTPLFEPGREISVLTVESAT